MSLFKKKKEELADVPVTDVELSADTVDTEEDVDAALAAIRQISEA